MTYQPTTSLGLSKRILAARSGPVAFSPVHVAFRPVVGADTALSLLIGGKRNRRDSRYFEGLYKVREGN